jgi:gas vesicle protein
MAGGKLKNRSNRNQGYLASSEPNSPTIASPGYTIAPEKQDMDLKSLLMMMIEDYKKEIKNCLKEIQENISNQVKELNKTIQDLKI